jgi:2-dehydropantoate 2-reductase
MMSPEKRVTVVVAGAGAIGSVVGGLLAKNDCTVFLLGRQAHMEAIRKNGLFIDGIWGTHHVTERLHPLISGAQLAQRSVDYVLVTVKSYDTESVGRQLRDWGIRFEALVSLQNGYGNVETLVRYFGPHAVLGARVITGAELLEPGHVRVTVNADAIRVGPPEGQPELLPLAEAVASLLQSSGIPAEPTLQYREYLWDKILYNSALNPLGAILEATYGELAADPDCRTIMKHVVLEAFAVAKARRIPLFWADAEAYFNHFYERLIPPTAAHYPSMLRDLQRRGRTEIDALNGAIVRLAEQVGLTAPTNQTLTTLIHALERRMMAALGGMAHSPKCADVEKL